MERIDFQYVATELVKNYNLKSKVKFGTFSKDKGGYNWDDDVINLRKSFSNVDDFIITVLHEIHHAIQVDKYGRKKFLKKYAQAFACISMFLIGAPLGSLIKRGGIGIPVIISIFFYIIYYVLNLLGLKWAREAIISPELAAWLSNLVLLPIGLFLLYHTRKDSKIFDIDYYVSFFNKII